MREFATPVQTCHLEAGGARFVGQGGLSVILWMAEGSEFDVVGHTCAFWAWASNREVWVSGGEFLVGMAVTSHCA